MIKKVHYSLNKFNQKMGISVTLPVPTKRSLKRSQYANGLIATGCLVLSGPFSSKLLLGIGVLSAASIVVTQMEIKALED